MEEELEISCPYCAESISISIDVFVDQQSYIEDCSVCCQPMQIDITCEDGAVISSEVGRS